MPIRLLIACGMLAVAGTASSQNFYYGHNAPHNDGHVAPLYDSHYYDRHRGHEYSHTYSHGYRSSHVPMAYQYGSFQNDGGSSHQGVAHGDFDHAHGPAISDFDSCPGTSGCPLQTEFGYADSPQQYEQYGDQQYGVGQFGSSQSHDGDFHDQSHTHDHGDGHNHATGGSASSLAPRGEIGRVQPLPRNEVPFREQAWPRIQTLPPIDQQPVAPPTLPPSPSSGRLQPQQFETPLGDGPPPNTVPLTSPRHSSDRNAEPTTLNI